MHILWKVVQLPGHRQTRISLCTQKQTFEKSNRLKKEEKMTNGNIVKTIRKFQKKIQSIVDDSHGINQISIGAGNKKYIIAKKKRKKR